MDRAPRHSLLVLLLAGVGTGCATSLARHEFAAEKMGTTFRIVLFATDPTLAASAAAAAFHRVDELNAIFSDYEPQSELNRLCRAATGQPVPVSRELWAILEQASEVSQRSGGAFDVTVGPIVRLWRRARHEGTLPAPERLRKALAAVGHQHLRLVSETQRVELLRPDMRLDLGGIAKGFAAREALAVLRRHGMDRALVDGGGDLALGMAPPGREGWAIGLVRPEGAPADAGRVLQLANVGVATSGDAYRFVEIDGVRYSHIVDPHTGLGVTTPSTVTVVAPDPALADALASAVSVLGPEQGLALVGLYPGASVLVVCCADGEWRTWHSPEFAGALRAR